MRLLYIAPIFALFLCCNTIADTVRGAATSLKVCPGKQLTLTCQTAQDQFLFWNIFVPHYNRSYSRLHASEGVREVTHEVVDAVVTLTFVRISESGVFPLVSQLSINNAATTLNGTMINCTEYSLRNIILQREIHIINSSNQAPNSPQLTWRTEEYNTDNVTVTLEWREEAGVSYSVSANPSPLGSKMISRNVSQLTILYNTSYSVVVLATLCGQNMNMTAIDIDVNYIGTCEHPFLYQSLGSSLYILDYSEPAIVGTSVSFNCSQPGKILVGPSTATCMEDGQWVPDPSQLLVNCKVSCGTPQTHGNVNYSHYTSTLEGSTITFRCTDVPFQEEEFTSLCLKNASWIPDPVRQCNDRILRSANCGPPPSPRNCHIVPYNSTLEGVEVTYVCWNVHQEENTSQCVEIYTTAICNAKGKWEPDSDDMCSIPSERSFEALSREGKIAVASSVTVFAITSILFFIIGFLSRHFCCKERKMVGTASPTEQAQIPFYDDVVLKQQKERELELRENVAYAQPVLSQINN